MLVEVNPEKQGLKPGRRISCKPCRASLVEVNPEKQGLKPVGEMEPPELQPACGSESRKTRIETRCPWRMIWAFHILVEVNPEKQGLKHRLDGAPT